jgi:pilus assembly protein CpaD
VALALLAVPVAARDTAASNRSMNTVHQPVVSRTDYTLDLAAAPQGLAPGEPMRLAGWFDGLALGYGDTVYVDGMAATGADAVGMVLSRYGMLVSPEPAPESVARAAPGTVRVVVSRAVARVEGCPDWSRGNYAEYGGALPSNYGCAAAQNLAAMIANPQDLVHGASAGPATDARISVKAIKSWRDAKNTGDGGLPGGATTVSVKGN